ncbi:MAG: alkaline phosphatase family protein [Nostocoides sp.]
MTARDRSPVVPWRVRPGDVGRALLGTAGAAIGLLIATWVFPPLKIDSPVSAVVIAAVVALSGLLLRPLLVNGAAILGWAGSVLVGLFGQAIVLWLVLSFFVRDTVGFITAFAASWIVAAVSTLFVWVATAGSDDAVTASLVQRARLRPASLADTDVDGVVFVQIDGVPFPVLQWGVHGGTLPTLARWVRSGSHRMTPWTAQMPATTPASQMGILHGTLDGIPAFRWIERSEGRIYVANRPEDAARIEEQHSNGRGLLVDDGVCVGALFTGDAPTAYATMSAVARTQETKHSRKALSRFLTQPGGMARSASRAISEIVRERFQAARAVRRDIRPRVRRGWSFAGERAALNGVLRDLNTSLVGDAMLSGRRCIYVNYVDYDAVSHHVGVMQPEALDALAGVDFVLGQLERVAAVAPRRYHLVVLSDHGQSQGATFADRFGEDLPALVSRLADRPAQGSVVNAEGIGSLSSALRAGGQESLLGKAATSSSKWIDEHQAGNSNAIAETERAQSGAAAKDDRFIVFGSGNLGSIYVAGEDHRLSLEELQTRFPGLVTGLVEHPGIGFVVVNTDAHGLVVLGRAGELRLADGEVVGRNPLRPFGEHAASFVEHMAAMSQAPDIAVNSLLDELGEVAAFEGLVGCHGGLGGWQDQGMLVWPATLPEPTTPIVRADALHDIFVAWLRGLGHRRGIDDSA